MCSMYERQKCSSQITPFCGNPSFVAQPGGGGDRFEIE